MVGGKRPIQKNAKNWSTTIQKTIDENRQDHLKLSSLDYSLHASLAPHLELPARLTFPG
jgi:hypothetical protein